MCWAMCFGSKTVTRDLALKRSLRAIFSSIILEKDATRQIPIRMPLKKNGGTGTPYPFLTRRQNSLPCAAGRS
jgi:hypothetical protein